MRIAAIDLGTNTFQMLIAERLHGEIRIIHKERRFVKIGEGGINKGFISPAAYQRALDTLKAYKEMAADMGVVRTLAVGTSAIRSASNGQALIDDVLQETGIHIRMINGEEEAMLIYEGVRAAISMNEKVALIIDIGGGSVEFILCNQKEVFWKQSFEIGAQRLYDRFHRSEPIAPAEVAELGEYLTQILHPLKVAIAHWPPAEIIGAAGAFGTLWELQQRGIMPLRGASITLAEFEELHRQFLAKNKAERLAMPGMLPMRVDMIVVASCLIEKIMDFAGFPEIRISAGSLKDGLMLRAFEG